MSDTKPEAMLSPGSWSDLCSDSVQSDANNSGAHLRPQAFGRNLKLGVIEDAGSRDQLAPLLRFPTSKSGEDMAGLDDYVSRCGCRHRLFTGCASLKMRMLCSVTPASRAHYCATEEGQRVSKAFVLALSALTLNYGTAEPPMLPAPG